MRRRWPVIFCVEMAGVPCAELADRDLADALKSRIHPMRDRHERLEGRTERKRESRQEAMEKIPCHGY